MGVELIHTMGEAGCVRLREEQFDHIHVSLLAPTDLAGLLERSTL